LIPGGIANKMGGGPFAVGVQIIGIILGMLVALGLLRIALRLVDNKEPAIGDLFSATWPQAFAYIVAVILDWVIVAIGLAVLVIPGIYFAIRLSMIPFLIIEKGAGPIEALRGSWEITRGSGWNLFLFAVLLTIINALGAIVFVVGLLWTLPTSLVAFAFAYRKLQAAPQAVPQTVPGPAPA